MKQFFQISKNRSALLLMAQLDLLSYSYLIVRTVRVADGSGKTKRHTNTALEATGQKKKSHVVDTTSVAGTQHSGGTCRIENTTCRALDTPAHAFYCAFLNETFSLFAVFLFLIIRMKNDSDVTPRNITDKTTTTTTTSGRGRIAYVTRAKPADAGAPCATP